MCHVCSHCILKNTHTHTQIKETFSRILKLIWCSKEIALVIDKWVETPTICLHFFTFVLLVNVSQNVNPQSCRNYTLVSCNPSLVTCTRVQQKMSECILWKSIGFMEFQIKDYCVLFIVCKLYALHALYIVKFIIHFMCIFFPRWWLLNIYSTTGQLIWKNSHHHYSLEKCN